jgi:nucleoside-diphosphate-sugar epimerase
LEKILITGVTGFIGGRLAEVTCERGIPTAGLVRTWFRAARLARLPVELMYGDLLDLDSLRRAMNGCDVIFHCAVDNRARGDAHRRASIEGTANVMRAALETGVKRVVHLSSTAVFGYDPDPDAATEDAPYRYSGDNYCDGKIHAEKVALRYQRERGLPVTVLRPTIVYGPFDNLARHMVNLIRQRRMVLINSGAGLCNLLYVDNLIDAMLLAATHDCAVGHVFHISDAAPVTWRNFIEAIAHAVGDSYLPLPEMSAEEIAAARPKIMNHPPSSLAQALQLIRDPRTRRALHSIPMIDRSMKAGKAVVRSLLPAAVRQQLRQRLSSKSISSAPNGSGHPETSQPLSQAEVYMLTTFERVRFSIEKARRMLGYDPKIDFSEGMERTTAWIKWARL